jgi:putative ABC transport system permease protein
VKELLGIPVGSLLVVLLGALAVVAGALAALALRNRVLVRISLRNVVRRRGRSALIVVGLMLGTAIIAAALTTGDTMSHTIRSGAIKAQGQTDEVVSARGALANTGGRLGGATGVRYFDARVAGLVAARLRGTGLADGVTPAIGEDVAVQDPARRQNEPRVTLFAADPARMRGFGTIHGTRGAVTLAQLRPGEIYLNAHAADELNARRGDRVLLFAGARPTPAVVRDVVRYDGGGTTDSGAMIGLTAAQRLLGTPGRIKYVLVSNRGGAEAGGSRARSDAVVTRLRPLLAPLGLEAKPTKADALRDADKAGSAFMAFFSTFGSFSIAAGILLIFLIFVMLAAERRSELGIARAVGTRRGHLVQLFTFEGAAYDLAAALVGALLGALVAYGMVALMAKALGSQGFDVRYAVTARSLLVAYALGVLLTLLVVAASAWRVSRMTIATAIRNLPEPGVPRRRRRIALALAGLALGALMTLSGAAAAQATPLLLGLSIVLIALVPLLQTAGVPERAAFTGAGLAIVVLWMLPWSVWEALFGKLAMNFSVWITGGLIVVVGAVWIIMYNAQLLSAAAVRVLGRWRRLAPVLRTSMAYPLSAKFRSGITLAMFTLVVFTLVTGTTSSGSFTHAFQDVKAYGGGFDVRATSSPAAPIDDMRAAIAATPSVRPRDFAVVASQSLLAVDARQLGTGRGFESYPLRGLDAAYLRHTTYGMAATARGYGSARAVWRAIATHRNLAVVDSLVVPRRESFAFQAVPSKFKLTGFYVDDRKRFDPIPLQVRDPQTGRRLRVTVIGVLADTVPIDMAGIWTSQASAAAAFPGRVRPTSHWFALRPGVDPAATAKRVEAAFLRSGMQADSVRKLMDDAVRSSLTFNRLIEGFIGLGLIVGVAALGVISARAVVERRQQIGVMRAIGFHRRMVQASFLLESSFVALTAIVVGTGLGLLLANNIIVDQRRQPAWAHLTLVVPWANLAIIFAAVYAVALLATWAPARRASRIRPAEALRYE